MKDEPPGNRQSAENRSTEEDLNVGSFAGAGLQFALAIVLFILLGHWVDGKVGTSPLFLLAGVFLGGGGAFYSMYRRLTAAQKADDERRKRTREQQKG